ncbi:autotransporter secretion inner membrane protein TamB [Hoeflea marina]|uniref:Autotransporter secretion inner membrane protein TamB n=1 Tax=Hoeflea marina TaxID=274592 RepID=A0A317PDX9_9HYPH|nr:translocation/assembly module TamB domain-containing protein [Hoeflea marina]PWV95353.1 autotransporter secretion inner membrane protein TamB [Hoeflea marina]
MIRLTIALLMFLLAGPAFAQDTPDEERSWLIGFVESRLSGPNLQIRIGGIQGVLSSEATIDTITVADRDGIWMRIVNARIDWNRSALLRGRLDIETLGADLIEVTRRPLPEEGLPSPEAAPFALPELPLAIELGNLNIARVTFGETVFGQAAELAVTGRLLFEDGSLDTALDMQRLDGSGGQLKLGATYANETGLLDLNLTLSEPENGVVANLLNVDGRPPIELALSGSGPVDDLDLALTLDAADERVLTGSARFDGTSEGTAFSADLEGAVSRLVAPLYRDFFGAETALQVAGVAKKAGGFRIDSLDLRSAALTLAAKAETTADGFLERLGIDAGISPTAGGRVVLPVPGGETTIETGRLQVDYDAKRDGEWTALLDLQRLVTTNFSADTIRLALDGLAQNPGDPAARRITYRMDGSAAGIVAERADVAEALGDTIDLAAEGSWQAGAPLTIDSASLRGAALSLTLAGEVIDYAYRGDLAIETSSIAPFSTMAGRELSGALTLAAKGEIRPVSGAFDLMLDGRSTDLRVANEAADNLLGGVTTITGRVARGETGLTADTLRIANPQVEITADGTYATGAADFDLDLALADLALVSPEASGRLTATGRATGSDGRINLKLDASVPSGKLAGKTLTQATIGFDGVLVDQNLDGSLKGDAFLDGVRVDLSSSIVVADGERRLSDLSFVAGGARLTGALTQTKAGLFTGALSLDAADISTAAALLLTDASGAINADIKLAVDEDRQTVDLSATIDALVLDTVRIGAAELSAQVDDAFGVPAVDGQIKATALVAAGIEVDRLDATASRRGEATDFTADAQLENGAAIKASGALSPEGNGYRLALDRADLSQGRLSAALARPASLLVEGSDVTIDSLELAIGDGSLSVSGSIAQAIGLKVAISALPLDIANAVRPDLELGGTLNGTAEVTGTRAAPEAQFDLRGDAVAAAALRTAGLGPLTIAAQGTTTGERLNVTASVDDGGGFSARVAGGVPLDDGALALDVSLTSFPLATLNALAPGQDLRGDLRGTARIGGTLADPTADFDLTAAGVSAAALATAGAAPIDVVASGRYADGGVSLTRASANGPQGLAVSASGRIPLSGPGLQLSVTGSAPMALANRFLVDRGTQFSGSLSLNANVTGSIADPDFGGTLSTSGAGVVDPLTQVRLSAISIDASLSAQAVTIRGLSATVGGGGSVSGSGSVSLNAAAGFPADIRIVLDQARYADGNFVVATVSGAVAINGPLTRDPVISGALDVDRAELSVAGSLTGGPAAIDVIHIAPPRDVAATLRRAGVESNIPVPVSRPSVVRLNVLVRAPNRIFVRGRGLDAELGGEVRLTGPLTDIQPVGAFNLIRGRLSILGQRITFDEGTVTLIGDLDPVVDFTARTEGSDITVFVNVRGPISDLSITFSSQPDLPQDEVLARLIFDRSLNELSAFQIARLAAAAAELAGGSGGGLLGNLRDAAGLDDLDVVSDGEGGTAVRAGRYIQDNIYLGVEAGSGGTTRGTINLDITDDVKARGSIGTGGDSSVGIFLERDY